MDPQQIPQDQVPTAGPTAASSEPVENPSTTLPEPSNYATPVAPDPHTVFAPSPEQPVYAQTADSQSTVANQPNFQQAFQSQPSQQTVAPLTPAPVTQIPTNDQPAPAFENIYTEICEQIIKEQGRIIGLNLALEQANNVIGLTVDPATLHCTVIGDGSKVINDLIENYSDFFGHAAVEVCREAASKYLVNLSAEQTPALLKS